MERNYLGFIDDLIALCHIIDDFEEFEEKLLNAMASINRSEFAEQLGGVSSGKTNMFNLRVMYFYSENKKVIDTINKYTSLCMFINHMFIVHNYKSNGEICGDIHFFYEYIKNHKDKIDKILAVLKKLKELGFISLEFDESSNFTNQKYAIFIQYSSSFTFSYLDQMEAIPSYYYDKIEYRTKNSPYEITIYARRTDISYSPSSILLNDLTFEPNRLPSTLSKEDTYDKILESRKGKKHQDTLVKNSVDLGIGIADLYNMFNKVYDKISSLSNMDEKEELIQLLATIKEAISKMQTISSEYDKKIVENNPNISQADLDEEKGEYARRRKLRNRHSS